MSRAINSRIDKALRAFELGIITRLELKHLLLCLAAYPHFFSRLSDIPRETLEAIVEMSLDAPAHPEDSGMVTTATFESPEAWAAYDSQMRLEHYWACRRLRDHFHPELPLPQFDPEISIGVVDKAVWFEGNFVLLGTFRCELIRNHPVSVRHDGLAIPITVVGNTSVPCGKYRESEDYVTRTYGYSGLIVDTPDGSLPEGCEGAEVWVDRRSVPDPEPIEEPP